MLWGYAGVPCSDFRWWDGDQTFNKLRWCAKHNFKATGLGLQEMEDPKRRDKILELREVGDLQLCPGFHAPLWKNGINEALKKADEFIALLEKYHHDIHAPIVCTGAGGMHRFNRSYTLEQQLDLLTELMTPVAQACYELGCPLAIENHGDYYCSDLVELCKRVPHLGIQLDTGNCYLIGEKPLPAAIEAAPYVLSTHFKDHIVYPSPCGEHRKEGGLCFCIDGAPLGDGDVPLREMFHAIVKANAHPEKIVFLWELVPPKGMNHYDALERSWEFCYSLEKELVTCQH